jgi:hypothetical protein
MNVTNIQENANSFLANGTKYLIQSALTVGRFEHFERLQLKLAYGTEFQEIHETIAEAMKFINAQQQGDAYVTLSNFRERVNEIGQRKHPMLMLCTLFITRENEDLTTWTEADATDKIEDWEKEALDVADFFVLAFGLVRGLSEAYEGSSRNTSPKAKRRTLVAGQKN